MSVLLTWDDNNAIKDGHRIYRSTSPMDPQNLPAPLAEVGPNVRKYVDRDVEPSTTYYYRVAVFHDELQLVGPEVEVTTDATPAPRAKLMLSLDELDEGLDNNLMLSGDAQTGGDLLEL